MELFLGIQDQWAEDSPHHLVILYEMFRHVAAEGQKEAEHIVHQGCQQTLPQLNPEAGIPAIQLAGPDTTKEELLELYLDVYKLHRLPGSPPGSQQYSKKCCPPSQTTKDMRKKRLLQPQHGPMLKAPILLGAMPPTEEGRMTQWSEVWPWCTRPIRKCWPQWPP